MPSGAEAGPVGSTVRAPDEADHPAGARARRPRTWIRPTWSGSRLEAWPA